MWHDDIMNLLPYCNMISVPLDNLQAGRDFNNSLVTSFSFIWSALCTIVWRPRIFAFDFCFSSTFVSRGWTFVSHALVLAGSSRTLPELVDPSSPCGLEKFKEEGLQESKHNRLNWKPQYITTTLCWEKSMKLSILVRHTLIWSCQLHDIKRTCVDYSHTTTQLPCPFSWQWKARAFGVRKPKWGALKTKFQWKPNWPKTWVLLTCFSCRGKSWDLFCGMMSWQQNLGLIPDKMRERKKEWHSRVPKASMWTFSPTRNDETSHVPDPHTVRINQDRKVPKKNLPRYRELIADCIFTSN